MKVRDLIGVVEAAYAIDRDDHAWLAGVHDALAPLLDAGMGTCAFVYDAASGPVRVLDTVLRDAPLDVETVKAVAAGASAAYVDRSWRARPSAYASEIDGYDEEPVVATLFAPAGIADMLAINAYDPAGYGAWVGAFCPRRDKLSQGARASFERLAAHVAAAYRLRRRITRVSSAVLTTSGRVLHAEGDAKLASARDALADAVREIDRARGGERRSDPDRAVRRWRTLVSARWSLLDQFERDGKRYIVAHANAPHAASLDALTDRERQVLSFAAIGHHPKLIAYDLGIAASTVRVLLARAGKKLGTRTMDATIRRYIELTRRERT